MEPYRPEPYLSNKATKPFDRTITEGVPSFAPFGIGVTDEMRQRLDSAGISSDDVFGSGIFSNVLPQWKARDLQADQRRKAPQFKEELAAQNYNLGKEAFNLNRSERMSDKNREDSQAFESSMNDRNIQARSQEVKEQGKLNMRQLAYSTTMQRQAIPTTWFK